MTDDRMAPIELIEKGAEGDLGREPLAFAAERVMELEVEAGTGAPAGPRGPDRPNHRNGGRERALGRHGRGGSTSPSRSRARAPASPRSWSRGACRLR